MLYIDRNLGEASSTPRWAATRSSGRTCSGSTATRRVHHDPACHGIVSEVLPTFSRKPLFGYKAFIFRRRGSGRSVSPCGPTTCSRPGRLPAVLQPDDIPDPCHRREEFNWVATMFRGKLRFTTAMLFAVDSSCVLIGGIRRGPGAVPVDYHVHAYYFIVAHIPTCSSGAR